MTPDATRTSHPKSGGAPTWRSRTRPARTTNPHVDQITWSVCGLKVQEVEDPLMRRIRYLDKLVDELAKGRPMEKVLRG